MNKVKHIVATILRYLLSVFMIYAGIKHFLNLELFRPFVPSFLPFTDFFVYSSGILEIVLGISMLFKSKIASKGALAVFILMLIFLPIHIKDVLVQDSAIGSHEMAIIRLPFQFVFLAWSWFVYRYNKN